MSEHMRLHATLSPSSAERWLECPASIRLISTLERGEDSSTVYAEEGTRAHNLAEIEASYQFDMITVEDYRTRRTAWLRIAETHGDDVEEMDRHVRVYVRLLQDIMASRPHATLRLEQRVQTGVPGCWGTGDAIIIAPTTIDVVDFKYGQGVGVIAHENPQLMLYGLGALEMFDGVIGDTQSVTVHICQPRVGGMSHYTIGAKELRAWRDDAVMPIARETQHPDARFGPSEVACRWCPASGICKARARYITERDFGSPDVLSMDELAEAFKTLTDIRDWCNAVEAEALKQAYSEGEELPGLKVVMSGGKRSIPDPPAAIKKLQAAGFSLEQVSRLSMKTLGDLERLVGKDKLPNVLGPLLVKSPGKPALVPESDNRPAVTALTAAAEDFQSPLEDEQG
jgi:hypothetical protein